MGDNALQGVVSRAAGHAAAVRPGQRPELCVLCASWLVAETAATGKGSPTGQVETVRRHARDREKEGARPLVGAGTGGTIARLGGGRPTPRASRPGSPMRSAGE